MTNFKNLSNWCGAKPIFYNVKTGAKSYLMDEVIDWNDAKIDLEGLYYYLRNGYSCFGKTFVKNVCFSRPWSRELDGRSADDFYTFLEKITGSSTIDTALDSIQSSILQDTRHYQNIVLPLSGGLDSRTLAKLVEDKSNTLAFTYNLIEPESKCHENGIARLVSNKLDIAHTTLRLKNPYHFLDYWFEDFGYCAQAHGMYHYDFFSQIRSYAPRNCVVLSGIVGDAWSGKIKKKSPNHDSDLLDFGYSHGQAIPQGAIKLNLELSAMREEFSRFSPYWDNRKFRLFYLISTKMMLLRFLLLAPIKNSFDVASPFIDLEVCANILNLNDHDWTSRAWQRRWLSENDLSFSQIYTMLKFSTRNDMNFGWATDDFQYEKLNIDLLSDFVDEKFLNSINNNMVNSNATWLSHKIMNTSKVGGLLRNFGFHDLAVQALNWYNVLLPVNKFLNTRRLYE